MEHSKVLEATGPRCRLCGYALKSTDGCDVCLPVKKVIVWPVLTNESETETARLLTQEGAKLIKRRLRKLSRAEKEEDRYNPQITRDLVSLVKTLKELSGEVRKLEDRAAAEYTGLSFDQQCELYLEHWFLKLPQEFQEHILDLMSRGLQAQSAPLLLESNNE